MDRKVVKHLNQVMAVLAVAAILIMMASTVADVSGRFLFRSPILGTYELNRTLLVFATISGLGYTQFMKRHVRTEWLLYRFPLRIRLVLEGVMLLLALVVMGFITYGCSIVAYESTIRGEFVPGIINFPMWPGRILVALGCLVLCMQYVIDIKDNLRNSLRRYSQK